ncbi:hypothetical protein, partial [Chitinophaga sp.]|uniref:hypothetical protein n=1 Tax=Chitinophaga sp. TaxID=1869181 RepID=UPI002C9AE885
MKKFYVSFLHILLWVLGSMAVSHKAMAQYTSSVLETGKYYTAIAKDNLDNIYVVAYNSATTKYQVLKYTNGAGTPTPIYQGLSLTVSEYPWSIAVNSAGDVFIMDPDVASNWRIVKLAAGSYTSSIIQSGRYFTALTVDNSDNLLAMEYDAATTNYRVVKYDALNLTGSGTTVYNGLPLATGSGTYPWGIVTDHSNNIYIIDFPYNSFNGRLIKLTAPAYTATTLGSGKNYTSLAIDGQDNLYTSEELSGTTSHVMKYTAPVSAGATGTEIATGLTIGSFFYPWGIAVNSHGDVFIDDGAAPGNGRVIKLSSLAISVASVTRASNNPTTASTVQYTVTFSATATNVTTSAFSLNTTGLTGASIAAVTGSGTTYTVTVNTGTGNGTLELVVTGNNMGNTVSGVPVNTGVLYTVDKTAPTITSVDVPANGIYHLNDGLRFKAHFSEPITVTGTPVLDITIGGTTRQATYQGGSGSDTLGFLYVVQAGDVDMDGIALGAAITGTVKDAAGNNA